MKSMEYKVFFTNKSEKELKKLAKSDALRVLNSLNKLTYPFPANADIRKMVNHNHSYRLRVGSLRVIFIMQPEEKRILILKTGYRGNIYQN